MTNVIGACGFIGTGSSAVSDFLKEFRENQVLDKFEVKLAYQTDGLLDLKYHLCDGNMKYESSISAIQRFKKMCKGSVGKDYNKMTNGTFAHMAEEYMDSLIQARWVGLGADPAIDPVRLWTSQVLRRLKLFKYQRQLEIMKGHELPIYPLQEIYFSMYPDDFDKKTQEFMTKVLVEMGWDENKNLVLDQPFAGNNPEAVFAFYKNPKAIIVDKDPRDYYIWYKTIYYKAGWRQMPTAIDEFIFCYKKLRESNKVYDNKNIIHINFEEMVYDYDNTSEKIMQFCGIKDHSTPFKYFNPLHSINNTQLFKNHPELDKEIKKIEEQLQEYLFDYSSYKEFKPDMSKTFFDNPLNRTGRKWKR